MSYVGWASLNPNHETYTILKTYIFICPLRIQTRNTKLAINSQRNFKFNKSNWNHLPPLSLHSTISHWFLLILYCTSNQTHLFLPIPNATTSIHDFLTWTTGTISHSLVSELFPIYLVRLILLHTYLNFFSGS